MERGLHILFHIFLTFYFKDDDDKQGSEKMSDSPPIP